MGVGRGVCFTLFIVGFILQHNSSICQGVWRNSHTAARGRANNHGTESTLSNLHLENELSLINNMNISIQRKLSEMQSKDDFAQFFGILSTRSRNKAASTSEAVEAVNAGCTPLLTPVQLKTPSPNDTYFPSCVLLERCGGCCFGDLLTCQPDQTEIVNLKVMKISTVVVTRNGGRTRQETTDTEVIVTEKRHLKCSCNCAVRREDCHPQLQSYNANECVCECSDREAKAECLRNDNSHFWDYDNCRCLCRDVLECSTGEVFSHPECRCKKSLGAASPIGISFNRFNDSSEKPPLLWTFVICIMTSMVYKYTHVAISGFHEDP